MNDHSLYIKLQQGFFATFTNPLHLIFYWYTFWFDKVHTMLTKKFFLFALVLLLSVLCTYIYIPFHCIYQIIFVGIVAEENTTQTEHDDDSQTLIEPERTISGFISSPDVDTAWVLPNNMDKSIVHIYDLN